MTTEAHLSPRLSWLALLCAWLVVFAWAAPILVDASDDRPDILNQSQDPASVPANVPPETEDASDDPVMFASIGKAGLLLLTVVLRASYLTERVWSPTLPVRPPNNLKSI